MLSDAVLICVVHNDYEGVVMVGMFTYVNIDCCLDLNVSRREHVARSLVDLTAETS